MAVYYYGYIFSIATSRNYGASVSEVADCTATSKQLNRETQTRGGWIGSTVFAIP